MEEDVVSEELEAMKEEFSDDEWIVFESKGMKKKRNAALKASNKNEW